MSEYHRGQRYSASSALGTARGSRPEYVCSLCVEKALINSSIQIWVLYLLTNEKEFNGLSEK